MNFAKKQEVKITAGSEKPGSFQAGKSTFSSNEMNHLDASSPKRARGLPVEENRSEEDIVDVSKLAVDIWTKKRCLKKGGEKIPIPTRFFKTAAWKEEELQAEKAKLNEAKGLIDSCNLDDWHTHTKKINTVGEVIPAVKKLIRPEYGSQAWCKFFECLNSYPIIPEVITNTKEGSSRQPFYSVHLCEAPGAFISATNHYMRTNYPHIQWDWLGTTLNPHHEGNDVGTMINEDKLILTSLKNWTFLHDNTGNIMSEANMNDLIRQVEKKFENAQGHSHPVSLVTADGSIDCQTNPMEQEAMVAHLHFAEIVAALHILGEGGTFVLKMFTFLECQAISHLYLLCSLFNEVHLFKPATSKEGNSEVYVICLKYLGKHQFLHQLMELKSFVDADNKTSEQYSLLPKSVVLRDPFVCRLIGAAKFFTGYQRGIINRNMEVYRSTESAAYFVYGIIRNEVAQEWLSRFGTMKLERGQRLFGKINTRHIAHVDRRREIGTFLDKLSRSAAGVWLKMKLIKEEMAFFKSYGNPKSIKSEIKGDTEQQILFQQGKPYLNILSSRFCFGKLLLQRQELRDAVKRYESFLRRDIIVSKGHLNGDCSESFLIQELSIAVCPDMKDLVKKSEWKLHIHCFHETFEDLYFEKDINMTRNVLKSVWRKVTSLPIGHSLFLCEFPLLTRLHVGLMYVLSSKFEKVRVLLNRRRTLRGVLLHVYKGMLPVDVNWIEQLTHVLMDLDESKESIVLQIIPTEVLANLENYDDIFEYNLYNTAANLDEIIDVTRKVLWKSRCPGSSDQIGIKFLGETPDELEMLAFWGGSEDTRKVEVEMKSEKVRF